MDTPTGKKIRGVDLSLIIEGSRKRQRVQTSPERINGTGMQSRGSGWAQTLATDPAGFQEVQKRGTALYDRLTNQRDPNQFDRMIHVDFTRVPSRTDYPDYYELIKKPMDFSTIKLKLDRLEYQSVAEIREDFNQTFVNAKRYNAPGSSIFMDAKRLHKVLKDTFSNWQGEETLPDEDHSNDREDSFEPEPPLRHHTSTTYSTGHPPPLPSTSTSNSNTGHQPKRGPTLKPWLKRKLDELLQEADEFGHRLADSFWHLPDRTQSPEYYRNVAKPIAIDAIRNKILNGVYTKVSQYLEDVNLLLQNNLNYHSQHSKLWNDAMRLKNKFDSVMSERPPEFVPPRTYNTARKRKEAEMRAKGLLPPIEPSSKKKHRRMSQSAGVSGSEPPEYSGGSEGEEDDEGDEEGRSRSGRSRSRADSMLDPIRPPLLNSMLPGGEELPLASLPYPVNQMPGIPMSYPVAPGFVPMVPGAMPANVPDVTSAAVGITSTGFGTPEAALPIIKANRLICKISPDDDASAVKAMLLRPHLVVPGPVGTGPLPQVATSVSAPANPIMIPTLKIRQHALPLPPSTHRVDLTLVFRETNARTDPKVRLIVRGGAGEARVEEAVRNPKAAGSNEAHLRTWSISLGSPLGPLAGLSVVELVVGGNLEDAKTGEVYRLFLNR